MADCLAMNRFFCTGLVEAVSRGSSFVVEGSNAGFDVGSDMFSDTCSAGCCNNCQRAMGRPMANSPNNKKASERRNIFLALNRSAEEVWGSILSSFAIS